MRNPKLVPYETIIRATSGEPETVDEETVIIITEFISSLWKS